MSDDRSAALLVRVWLEEGGRFRARLSTFAPTRGGGPGEELTVAVASSPRDVISAMSEWLDEVVGHAPNPIDGEK